MNIGLTSLQVKRLVNGKPLAIVTSNNRDTAPIIEIGDELPKSIIRYSGQVRHFPPNPSYSPAHAKMLV